MATLIISDNILHYLDYLTHSAADHTIRLKYALGTVTISDSRCVANRLIQSRPSQRLRGLKTTISGDRPYFDGNSESWEERSQRLAKEITELNENLEIKRRMYNNTPLRRIVERQALRDVTASITKVEDKVHPTKSEASNETTLVGEAPLNSPRTETIPVVRSGNRENREERTERWAREVTVGSEALKKRQARVGSTPLTRILNRQLAATT